MSLSKSDRCGRRRKPNREHVPADPLLTAREAALERAQAISTFWRDVKFGRVPKPIYVTPRAPRWRLSTILASIDACRAPAKPEAR